MNNDCIIFIYILFIHRWMSILQKTLTVLHSDETSIKCTITTENGSLHLDKLLHIFHLQWTTAKKIMKNIKYVHILSTLPTSNLRKLINTFFNVNSLIGKSLVLKEWKKSEICDWILIPNIPLISHTNHSFLCNGFRIKWALQIPSFNLIHYLNYYKPHYLSKVELLLFINIPI